MNKTYFRWNFKVYSQEYCDGNLLLWAKNIKNSETHFLGCFKDNDIKESETLREKDWDIQKGAQRLFSLVYKRYYCRELNKKQRSIHQLDSVGRPATMPQWQ